MTQVLGHVDPRFNAVAEAFAEGFSAGRDVGAALCVIQNGVTVVDLWAGHRDRKKTKPWEADTPVCCFSISKAISALCVLRACQQSHLDLDAPVTRLWPEFGTHGKEDTTLRHVLAHQAGLPGLRADMPETAMYDWPTFTQALADETPWWTPGTQHGYHARTLGFLLGELLRRGTGVDIKEWLRAEITGPLDAQFAFGLAPAEHDRCADMIPAKIRPGQTDHWSDAMKRMLSDFHNRETPTGAAFQNPAMSPGYMNKPAFRNAVIPAVNGHGTARGVARMLSHTRRLIGDVLHEEAQTTHSSGPDAVLKSRTRFGLGVMLYEDESPIGWPGCFGHAGAGGSVAFYDPSSDTAFAFLMNQMEEGVVTGGTSALRCSSELLRQL